MGSVVFVPVPSPDKIHPASIKQMNVSQCTRQGRGPQTRHGVHVYHIFHDSLTEEERVVSVDRITVNKS